jgi:hypothetical protein
MSSSAPLFREDEPLARRFTLPVEERPHLTDLGMWNGSYRWFRSANVIDLWGYRSPTEQQRMIDLAWNRWRHYQRDDDPLWPPPETPLWPPPESRPPPSLVWRR